MNAETRAAQMPVGPRNGAGRCDGTRAVAAVDAAAAAAGITRAQLVDRLFDWALAQ